MDCAELNFGHEAMHASSEEEFIGILATLQLILRKKEIASNDAQQVS